MNDGTIPQYPWHEGDTVYASALNAAIANAGGVGGTGGAANVIGYGADPTGVADSTSAIRAALAVRPARNVYLPAGTYRITDSLIIGGNDGASQTLFGDGVASVLMVNADFNPAATGVLLVTNPAYNAGSIYGIRDLQVACKQPGDFVTTTTVAASTGATTLTLASASGVRVGNYAYTPGDAIPAPRVRGAAASAVVTSVVGNVVTFSKPLLGNVLINAPVYFAPARAQFAALGAGTSGVGGTGVRYPWVINSGDWTEIANVLILNAWDGIHIRGSACRMLNIRIGAFDIGYDLDQCFNWHMCDQLEFWTYGLSGLANQQVFYDGQTIAANFGRTDGMLIGSFAAFVGMVNLTSTWSFGQIANLGLDDNFSCLNAIGVSAGAWAQIGNLYSTKGSITSTPGINVTGPMRVTIANAYIGSDQESLTSAISVSNGQLNILGGDIYGGGTSGAHPVVSVTGGRLVMNNVQANYGGAGGLFLQQSGPNGIVQLRGVSFQYSLAGALAVLLATDNQQNVVSSVGWNGWVFNAPGNLGYYEPSQARPYSHLGGFVAAGTTQATATAITAAYTTVVTVATGAGVILPAIAGVGTRFTVWNKGANPLTIYPPVGWLMYSLAINAPVFAQPGSQATFVIWDSLSIVPEFNGPVDPTGLPTQGGITATGTTSAGAYVLTSPYSSVTVAAGHGVRLPLAAAVGSRWVVFNIDAGSAVNVYPPTGHSIFPLGTDIAISVALSSKLIAVYFGGGAWLREA